MILVTGATGNVGRPLIDLLAADGVQVRAVTRDPQAAEFPPGVEVVSGDPSRPDTIAHALADVSRLFVNPRAVGRHPDELLALAGERGAQRVVVLSASNVDDDTTRQPSRYRGDYNREVENAVVNCGLDWVSLRATVFAPNTIGLWGAQIRAGDIVRGPYASAVEAPIDPRDIARVAARALLDDPTDLLSRHAHITGPEVLTLHEMVTVIGKALGRSLRYQEIPPDAARSAIVGLGFSAEFADANLARLAHSLDQPPAITDEVAKILGRPATSLATWAASHAPAFGH